MSLTIPQPQLPPQLPPQLLPQDHSQIRLNDIEYWNRYFEMMIVTVIVSQVPQLVNGILLLFIEYLKALLIYLSESFWKWKKGKIILLKYKYSKTYSYSCSTTTYTSNRYSRANKSNNEIGALVNLTDLLNFIVKLNYAQTDLDNIEYNFLNITGTNYKVPIIRKEIKLNDDLWMFWSVNKKYKEHQPVSSSGSAGESDTACANYHITEEETEVIITLYSNATKGSIESFEEELQQTREASKLMLNDYQTISYYYHKKTYQGDGTYNSLWETYSFKSPKVFDNIFLPEKDKIFHVLQTFTENKNQYCILGKQNYLGILLYGLPGCGKTSLIKAIANYTKRNIYSLKLSEIDSDEELKDIFQDESVYIYSKIPNIPSGIYVRPFEKRIIVIEDIDIDIKLIEDRKTKMNEVQNLSKMHKKINQRINGLLNSKNDFDPEVLKTLMRGLEDIKLDKKMDSYEKKYDQKFNLDVFLNILDGIKEQDGTIFIMTTNYPEKIDRALIRPGRCDLRIEFKKADIAVMLEMLAHYYLNEYNESDFCDENKNLLTVVDKMFTASEFCQILYENSYLSFKQWLNGINNEPGKVQEVLSDLKSPSENNVNKPKKILFQKKYSQKRTFSKKV